MSLYFLNNKDDHETNIIVWEYFSFWSVSISPIVLPNSIPSTFEWVRKWVRKYLCERPFFRVNRGIIRDEFLTRFGQSRLRRFWIRNLKWKFESTETFRNQESFCRVNDFLSNVNVNLIYVDLIYSGHALSLALSIS